ncbi:MAG: DUF6482 family protein [Pseudomonadota bacterium]
MTLTELKRSYQSSTHELSAQSFEGGIYLLSIKKGQNIDYLQKPNCDEPQVFRNFHCIEEIAHSVGATVKLEIDSAYDEMIGNPSRK